MNPRPSATGEAIEEHEISFETSLSVQRVIILQYVGDVKQETR